MTKNPESHSPTNGIGLKNKLTENTWFFFDTKIHDWLNRYGEAGKEIRTQVPLTSLRPWKTTKR